MPAQATAMSVPLQVNFRLLNISSGSVISAQSLSGNDLHCALQPQTVPGAHGTEHLLKGK